MRNKPRKWSQDEVQYLKENFRTVNCTELAKHLGRSVHAIRGAMVKYELYRTPKERLKIMEPTFRKIGSIPVNKGTRGFKIARRKNRAWRLPVQIGTIRIIPQYRGDKTFSYKKIKVKQNKWVDLHRYNWEKTYGKIPYGFVMQFKDGNSLNCEPSNLYLINRYAFRFIYRNVEKIRESHRKRYASGKAFESDRWIAGILGRGNSALRELALQNLALIQIKRAQLMMQKQLREMDGKGTTCLA